MQKKDEAAVEQKTAARAPASIHGVQVDRMVIEGGPGNPNLGHLIKTFDSTNNTVCYGIVKFGNDAGAAISCVH
jgi:hypothetical protein